MKRRLGLGIDTGGTYTDSVIIEFDTGKVLVKAKAFTTRNDLSIGIADSIERLQSQSEKVGISFDNIALVSASTTLATNAIVEGKGARACLIAIGYDKDSLYKYGLGDSFPIKEVKLINGGHDILGNELKPLDQEALKAAILETKKVVDAYGVSAYGGVRNPEHEIKARQMIQELTSLPVICGHDLTSNLNAIRRAITVALNARLVPIVRNLICSIRSVLSDRGIKAPLMIVKGDGQLISDDLAMERPIETVLSGPAASITGGSYLSGIKTGIVVDMGGTTTDIAIIRNGYPELKAEGAIVGEWRTSIKAVNVQTSGLGGDSHISIDRTGKINIGPQRVIPISMASSQYPEVLNELKQLNDMEWKSYMVGPTDFLIRLKDIDHLQLNETQVQVCKALDRRPRSILNLSRDLGLLHPALLNVSILEETGTLGRIGLSPTDILHAEGTYTEWDTESARIATDIYARHLSMETDRFIREVKEQIMDRLASEIISKLISEKTNEKVSFNCEISRILLNKVLGKELIPELLIRPSLTLPIIAIGAPVASYFPGVAKRLGADLVLPEHAEVANAVGAITGSVVQTIEVLIDPIYTPAGLDHYSVYTPEGKYDFLDLDSAKKFATSVAISLAKQRALKAGAGKDVEVKVESDEQMAKPSDSYGLSQFLLSCVIRATAVAKPSLDEEE